MLRSSSRAHVHIVARHADHVLSGGLRCREQKEDGQEIKSTKENADHSSTFVQRGYERNPSARFHAGKHENAVVTAMPDSAGANRRSDARPDSDVDERTDEGSIDLPRDNQAIAPPASADPP